MRLIAATTALLSFVAVAFAQPPIPPPGLFCCPPVGPDGLTLDRQQINPYAIFCYYDAGTTQNPATGAGGGPATGCPISAVSNPHPPTCPV